MYPDLWVPGRFVLASVGGSVTGSEGTSAGVSGGVVGAAIGNIRFHQGRFILRAFVGGHVTGSEAGVSGVGVETSVGTGVETSSPGDGAVVASSFGVALLGVSSSP